MTLLFIIFVGDSQLYSMDSKLKAIKGYEKSSQTQAGKKTSVALVPNLQRSAS
jgi:hypothetical protein